MFCIRYTDGKHKGIHMAIIVRPLASCAWVDVVGNRRNTSWMTQAEYFAVPTDVQIMMEAASLLSNGGQTAIAYQVPMSIGSSPVAGPYSCTDAATFYVKSAGGLLGVISVPDPALSIFKSDRMTVDQTNTDVLLFVSYMYAYLGDSNGNPWTSIRKAVRTAFPG